ncbi:MAG: CoA transferase [Pseudomonadota bacterium]
MQFFDTEIAEALGEDLSPNVPLCLSNPAELPSCFGTSDLAVASIGAAAREVGAHLGVSAIALDQRLASAWFDLTLKPQGWETPSVWDAIAGVYQAKDGWVRLHTNAPHHRDAALRVLGCAAEKSAVAEACATWAKDVLEDAIVAEGGAAAAMRSLAAWADHPQGRAVAAEPLIAWQQSGEGAAPLALAETRVLDLTRVLAGPVATRFLAGFGAQVLRVDPLFWNEPGVEPEVTVGKRRAGLDLTARADRETFEQLVSQADVLVHGYRPGALAGLGYDTARLHSLAPQMIDISLCAYGWSGPWAGRRGFDSLVQMSSGIAQEGMRRAGGSKPVPLPVQALDHATGYLMAAAALRALRRRKATGQILSAQLSLARTAALLVARGAHAFRGNDLGIGAKDYDPALEHTDWGPAKRLTFPVQLDGTGPTWTRPAGRLRADPPAW